MDQEAHEAEEQRLNKRFKDPLFCQGWSAWLNGKAHNDNPYRDATQAERWDAGLMAAAHETA